MDGTTAIFAVHTTGLIRRWSATGDVRYVRRLGRKKRGGGVGGGGNEVGGGGGWETERVKKGGLGYGWKARVKLFSPLRMDEARNRASEIRSH